MAGSALRIRPPASEAATVAAAQSLLQRAEDAGIALALDQLGDITLPPATAGSATDQAYMRAIASLYFAAELEAAMLLPAAEALIGLAMSGGVTANLRGATVDRIATLWRERHQRTSPEERRAVFAHLFGASLANASGIEITQAGPPNEEFESLLLDLCEALYKLDEEAVDLTYGSPDHQIRVRTAAERLTESLLRHTSGAAQFLADDILSTVRQVLSLFQLHELQAAYGARDLWDLVGEITKRYLRASPDIHTHLSRGKSGMLVLSWLAEILPRLTEEAPNLVALADPVIAAATEWMQGSLSLSEHASATQNGRA
jgi:hypothetical protein